MTVREFVSALTNEAAIKVEKDGELIASFDSECYAAIIDDVLDIQVAEVTIEKLFQGRTAIRLIVMEKIDYDVNDVVNRYILGKTATGCAIEYLAVYRSALVTLSGPVSEVRNTGVFDALDALVQMGYAVSVNGTEITGVKDFMATDVYALIAALEVGGRLDFTVTLTLGDDSEDFKVILRYSG